MKTGRGKRSESSKFKRVGSMLRRVGAIEIRVCSHVPRFSLNLAEQRDLN